MHTASISHSIELSLALNGKHKTGPAHERIAAEWLIHKAERMDASPPPSWALLDWAWAARCVDLLD